MNVTICVGTFGSDDWYDLARERAVPSGLEQAPVVHAHRDTLAEARNAALASVESEWVVHLDADDSLDPGYVAAMAKGTADVRGPMALYVTQGGERLWQPRVAGHHHDCTADCLPHGNWLLVGAAVRTEIIRKAGGWRDWSWSEDWDTWLRCWKVGATFELVRDAIYRAYVSPQSRNRGATQADRLAAHKAIHEANFGVAA